MAKRTMISGRYELDEVPLARGGMGEVWVGRDIKLEREIAVKFIRLPEGRTDEDLVRRFVRESRITARLEHPGVPAVYDVGTHENRPYIVMQRVRGVSVSDLVAEYGALPIGWATAIAAQVCAVLSIAHQASLVHRDLKPGNLMLCPDGTVKVLDFGLAVALDLPDRSQITRTGQSLGTPAYMAPEQVLAGMSGPHTDLYALGATLHEMLTGKQVFYAPTAYALMSKQVDEPVRPLHVLRPDLPSALDALVLQLLEKKQEDRPATAADVFARLFPFVTHVGPLPGALSPESNPSPTRMYAQAVSRVLAGASMDSAPTPTTSPDPAPPRDVLTGGSRSYHRDALDRARSDASSLVRRSRYSQAAEVLAQVIHPATGVLGRSDPGVISLRFELANVLFEGGDFCRAAPAYRELTTDLASRDGPDADLVLRCRLQEATCHALTGQTARALIQLASLVDDEQRVYGADDPRALELRRQIGLLQLGAGQRGTAEATLRSLLDDVLRLHGPDHPTAVKVQELLAGANRSGGS